MRDRPDRLTALICATVLGCMLDLACSDASSSEQSEPTVSKQTTSVNAPSLSNHELEASLDELEREIGAEAEPTELQSGKTND